MKKIFYVFKGVIRRRAVVKVLTGLILLPFFSCNSKKIPEGMLTQEQMVPILLDVYIGESRVNEFKVKRDSAMILFHAYEQKIFEKYEISDSVYRMSVAYYYDHPDELESIYETLLDSLNLMEKRLEEKNKEKEEEEIKEKEGEDNEEKRQAKEIELLKKKLDA
ncbi:DUF4296 domain-containing protein [Fulvivirga sp. M361]|uniref:DUF4296 domain-containing protein n=1 Tax=Fulvivirga sp. M361 TaxID=2594266 RepID=UPI00117A6737|nr:DUF4296 domain-containing protein [Fulvivirga sp. M361]TRX49854.1 DUF4296 domain-containing protein [Fulvivirga sp. M361]